MPPTPIMLDFTPENVADNIDALVTATLDSDREVGALLVKAHEVLWLSPGSASNSSTRKPAADERVDAGAPAPCRQMGVAVPKG
jgi:hypothetical protein